MSLFKLRKNSICFGSCRQEQGNAMKNAHFDKDKRPDVVLLDDGYQHRSVQPSMSILLVGSNRPVYEDKLLPSGLREPLKGKNRASIVLVTKCHRFTTIDFRIYSNDLDLFHFRVSTLLL